MKVITYRGAFFVGLFFAFSLGDLLFGGVIYCFQERAFQTQRLKLLHSLKQILAFNRVYKNQLID
jgi:hypothetical protein